MIKSLFLLTTCSVMMIACRCLDSDLQRMPLLNIDYQYSYSDVPAEARLRTRFVSLSKRELCVGRENWPSSGYLSTNDGTSNGVYLVVAQRIYAFEDTRHWAVCREKRCYHPLGKGES